MVVSSLGSGSARGGFLISSEQHLWQRLWLWDVFCQEEGIYRGVGKRELSQSSGDKKCLF